MTRTMILATALCFTAYVSADAPKEKPATQQNIATEMAGTWVPVEGVAAGKKLPDNFLAQIKLILGEGKYNTVVGEEKEDGTYKLDATKKPATCDITVGTGPNKGKTIPAIIEVNGDTMKVCYNTSGGERPKDFMSTETNKFLTLTYKREKPKK